MRAPLLGIWSSQISGHLTTYDYDSIATVTVGAGGSSTISFSSISSSYKHLQLRIFARDNGASSEDAYWIRFNSDTGNNYAWHYLMGNGSSASASAGSTTSRIYINNLPTAVQSAGFGVAVIDILDYTNTNKYKTLRSLSGYDVNGTGTINLVSGLWQSTTAINSITITNDRAVAFLQYSSFALYGVK